MGRVARRWTRSGDPANGARAHEQKSRPDLEGVRALAVLGVVVYHLRPGWLPGGFAGVDIFFVLSGFFITTLLVRESQRTGRVDLAAFWGRRARRLLPASVVVLVVTLLASAAVADTIDSARFAVDARYAAVFGLNWRLAQQGTDYLADPSPTPFVHYWSLGVEEQFYVVWPVLLLLVTLAVSRRRALLRRALLATVVLVGVVSFVIAYEQTVNNQPYAYFATYGRVWQLGVGAALALLAPRLSGLVVPLRIACRVVGLSLIVGFYALTSLDVLYPGWHSLVPVAGAALIVAGGVQGTQDAPATSPRDPVWRTLASRPGRALGRYSYSWYLWHWPPLVLLPLALHRPLGTRGLLLTGAGTLVLAVVSYHVIENPLRTSRRLAGRRGFRSLALGAALVAVALGATQVSAAYTRHQVVHTRVVVASGAVLHPAPEVAAAETPLPTSDGCEVGVRSNAVQRECRYLPDTGHGDIVLVGDSHAVQWFSAVRDVAARYRWGLRVWARAACPLADIGQPDSPAQVGSCHAWRRVVMNRLVADRPSLVIVTGLASYFTTFRDPATGRQVGGARAREIYRLGMVRYLTRLRAAGIPVLVIRDNPFFTQSGPKCVLMNVGHLNRCSEPIAAAILSRSDGEAARATPGVHLLDLTSHYCHGGRCYQVVGDILAYRDNNHLTAEMVRSMIPQLAAAAVGTVRAG